MHRIPLRVLPDPENPSDVLDYRVVIKAIVRRPLDPQKGVDIEEMRRGIRILDAVDATKGNVLELEDADHAHLAEKLRGMQWAAVDRRVIEFIDDVTASSSDANLNHVWNDTAVQVG